MIDQVTVDRIIGAADIVEVVQDYVSLKKRGVNYLGNCPFHNEKTPSFTVSPAKGIYKCFGCGKGGNSVSFIMEHEHLTYVEALKFLAKKYHIEVEEKEVTAEELKSRNERESLMVTVAWAQRYFTDILHKHTEGKSVALSYFKERGFRDDIIEKFQLGYCLEQRNAFSTAAQREGYKLEYLVKTGLSIQRENDAFDRFMGRVMFPIHSISGRVIAFGGRIMRSDKKLAKYINSPESDIYHKSNVLYGIYFAKQSITQQNRCLLVEGYTDVISLHQAGIENVVASSGTALTPDQIRLIKRFTPNITMLYDGDTAGIKASLRGIDLVLEEGLNVKVVLLPDGEDPDSYARSHSATEVLDFIAKNETDFIHFKTRLLLDDAKNDPIKKAGLITDIVRTISVIPDSITRSVYIKECSRMLDIDESILYTEVGSQRRKKLEEVFGRVRQEPEAKPITPSVPSFVSEVFCEEQEKEIIYFLLKYGHKVLFQLDSENLEPNEREVTVGQYIIAELMNDELDFQNLVYRKVFNEYKTVMERETQVDNRYFINFPDPEVSSVAVDILAQRHRLSRIWDNHPSNDTDIVDYLNHAIPKAIMVYKSKIIQMAINNLRNQLGTLSKEQIDEQREVMQQMANLTNLRGILSKELSRILV